MKAIAQLVVRVFDLLEAEGRALRAVVRVETRRMHTTATNMAMGATCLLIAVPLCIAGFGLLAAGLLWWLETQFSRPLAAGLTGLVTLGAGGGCILCFRALAARHQP